MQEQEAKFFIKTIEMYVGSDLFDHVVIYCDNQGTLIGTC